MPNVVPFKPRPRSPEPATSPLPTLDLRTQLEGAAQTALDAAEKVMAALDHLDGHDGASPPLAATIAGHVEAKGEGTFRFRYTPAPAPIATADPEPDLVEQVSEQVAEPEVPAEPISLPWCGAGNVVAAVSCVLLALIGVG